MAHDGVGDIELDVYCLSDNELQKKLRQLGANIGPITGLCCVVILLRSETALTVCWLIYQFILIVVGLGLFLIFLIITRHANSSLPVDFCFRMLMLEHQAVVVCEFLIIDNCILYCSYLCTSL